LNLGFDIWSKIRYIEEIKELKVGSRLVAPPPDTALIIKITNKTNLSIATLK